MYTEQEVVHVITCIKSDIVAWMTLMIIVTVGAICALWNKRLMSTFVNTFF